MNTDTAQRYILLEQSGELSERQRRRLETHLSAHPEDRAYRNELYAITAAAQHASPEATPDRSLNRILAEARATSTGQALPVSGTLIFLRPALALAALCALCLVGWVFLHEPGSTAITGHVGPEPELVAWDTGLDEQISELNSLFASVDEEIDISDATMDDWATELLEREGSAI